jgi:hypothetical protein
MRSKWLMAILATAPAWALAQNGGMNGHAWTDDAPRDGGVVGGAHLFWAPRVPDGALRDEGPRGRDPVVPPGGPVVRTTAVSAPEVDARLAAGGLTFLVGGLVVLRSRRIGARQE